MKDNRSNYQIDYGVTKDYIIDFLGLDERSIKEIFGNTNCYVLTHNRRLKHNLKKAKISEGYYDLNILIGIPRYKKIYSENEIKLKYDIDCVTNNTLKDYNIKEIYGNQFGSNCRWSHYVKREKLFYIG